VGRSAFNTALIFCPCKFMEGGGQEERPLFLLTLGTSDAWVKLGRGKNELTCFASYLTQYHTVRVLHPSKIDVGWVGVRCHPTRLFTQSGVGCPPDTRPYFGRVSGTGRVDPYYPINYP
jgi:hypothetical protein